MNNRELNFGGQKRFLIVTVDTEEEGLWSGEFRSRATVKNISQAPLFQRICNRYGIRPTYVVTTPVVRDTEASNTLNVFFQEGQCEVGTHVHPWNSPPITEFDSQRKYSYMCNLPSEVQYEKLANLTEEIENAFGHRPVSFRAGRYGIGSSTIALLSRLGYTVDSSVLPLVNYASQGGPDFRLANCLPYFPSETDLLSNGPTASLLEVPVTSGFTHKYFEIAGGLKGFASQSPWRQLKAVGILDRLGIASQVKLSPEQASLKQMKKLSLSVLARGVSVLVLMFHSSSLLPGCSPYVKSQNELDAFLKRIDDYFSFAIEDCKMSTTTLGEFASHFNPESVLDSRAGQ